MFSFIQKNVRPKNPITPFERFHIFVRALKSNQTQLSYMAYNIHIKTSYAEIFAKICTWVVYTYFMWKIVCTQTNMNNNTHTKKTPKTCAINSRHTSAYCGLFWFSYIRVSYREHRTMENRLYVFHICITCGISPCSPSRRRTNSAKGCFNPAQSISFQLDSIRPVVCALGAPVACG